MRVLSTVFFMIVLASSALAQDLPLAPAVEAIRSAFDAHESIKAQVEMKANIPIGSNRVPMVGTGDVAYQKSGQKYLQQLTLRMPEPLQMEARVNVLALGTQVWVTTDVMGNTSVKEEKPNLGKGAIPPGGKLLFDLIETEMTLTRTADVVIDNKPAYAFVATPKADAGLPYVKAEFEVDQESGILREARLYESAGAETVSIRQFDFELNPDLSGVDFNAPKAAGSGGGSAPAADAASQSGAGASGGGAPSGN